MTATCWVSVSSGDPYTPGLFVCGHPLPCPDHPLVDETPELRARLKQERVEKAKQETRNWFVMADRVLQGGELGVADWENVASYLGIAAQWAERAAQLGRKP